MMCEWHLWLPEAYLLYRCAYCGESGQREIRGGQKGQGAAVAG